MKLSITPSEKYPRHELEIKDWLAKEKEFYNQFKSQVSIIRDTEKAYQIKLEKSEEMYWIPKSQCSIIKRDEISLFEF
jgi:hypothetical protein